MVFAGLPREARRRRWNMPEAGQLGSWTSDAYVAEWLGGDALQDLLLLPRRISAALVDDDGV
jgi:hypothetical protein